MSLSTFWTYLQLGFYHIADINAYDHILFIISLCVAYIPQNWKQILTLVTAFTLGHSLTLLLASLQIIVVSSYYVELAIAISIVLTCGYNLLYVNRLTEKMTNENIPKSPIYLHYTLALVFGCIHGLGFSGFLRAMLGKATNIIPPLLAFNIGLEFGQMCLVMAYFTTAFVLMRYLKISHKLLLISISGSIAILASIMAIQRIY